MSLLPDNSYGWGPIETTKNYGRIGISANVSCTDDDENAMVTLEVWFWSKYSATDSNNNLYFDLNTTTASTYVGKVDIRTTHNSGSGWNAANKVHVYTYGPFPVARETSDKTLYCAAKLTGVEIASGTMTHWISYVVPAIKSYIISYSPNGYNATVPASENKYHNQPYTVSSTAPSPAPEGYICNCWITDVSHGYTEYPFGSQYTANESITLYARWDKIKYCVSLDPKGGAIDSITSVKVDEKEYGELYALPIPTRTDYNFLGWSTNPSSTTVDYPPGVSYTVRQPLTLYAVWELAHIPPIISNVVVERCEADGTHADDGTYFDVSFDWATDEARNAMGLVVYIKAYLPDGKLVVEETFDISVFSSFVGNFSLKDFNITALGDSSIDSDNNYTVTVTVVDYAEKANTVERTLMSVAYPIDIYKEGKGVAFGKPASREGAFDINFDAVFNKSIEFGETALQSLKPILLDMFYPVHSIYISHSHEDPNELFGGTWERIVDRFLWGVDEEAKIGTTGGERTHTLTAAEMPEHQHTLLNYNENGYTTDEWTKSSATIGASKKGFIENLNTSKAGGGQSHNNMPPYVQVSIWHRTA